MTTALYLTGALLLGLALGCLVALAWLTWNDRPPRIPPPQSLQRFPKTAKGNR